MKQKKTKSVPDIVKLAVSVFVIFTLMNTSVLEAASPIDSPFSIAKYDGKAAKETQSGGLINVYMFDGDKWRAAGQLAFANEISTHELVLPDKNRASFLTIRLDKVKGGTGHIDCVTVNDKPALSVVGVDRKKLDKKDMDTAQINRNAIEMNYLGSHKKNDKLILKLTASID